MYELMCGSIFDTKCDMIVIPCDNYTNVTSMVLKSIYDYRIPRARNIMKPGEIEIYLNNRSLVNTSVICYAASVNAKNTKCEPEYLDRICSEIIDYCKENSINIVNIPLLGTGAGGLTIYESFDILKSHFIRSDSIKARIFSYTNDIYTKLRNHDPDSIKASIKVPRVFVSYTGIDNDSVMSKLLIMIILCCLKCYNGKLTILYSEPSQWGPSEKKYNETVKNRTYGTCIGLSSVGVGNLVRTPYLSNVVMQNCPILLVAFLSFNEQLINVLINEIIIILLLNCYLFL